jgi:ketosteroid isomerase-like protein
MSEENVAIVRAAYEAFNRGDMEAGAAFFDPAIEWSTPPNLPEAGTWHGEEEVMRGVASFLESFESLRADVQDVVAAPDGRVVSLVRFVGLGRDTGLAVEGVSVDAQVWTLRDGRIVRVEMYSGSADALEAVGLEPR